MFVGLAACSVAYGGTVLTTVTAESPENRKIFKDGKKRKQPETSSNQ